MGGDVFLRGDQRSNGVRASEGQHLNGVVDLHRCFGVYGGLPLFRLFLASGEMLLRDVEMRRSSGSRKTTPRILSNLVADNISNQ